MEKHKVKPDSKVFLLVGPRFTLLFSLISQSASQPHSQSVGRQSVVVDVVLLLLCVNRFAFLLKKQTSSICEVC